MYILDLLGVFILYGNPSGLDTTPHNTTQLLLTFLVIPDTKHQEVRSVFSILTTSRGLDLKVENHVTWFNIIKSLTKAR